MEYFNKTKPGPHPFAGKTGYNAVFDTPGDAQPAAAAEAKSARAAVVQS